MLSALIALSSGCAAAAALDWNEIRLQQPDTGYWLFVMTSAPPLDFSSAQGFIDSLRKNAGGKHDGTLGHSWLKLVAPDRRVECGHTGQQGIEVEGYQNGVIRRIRQGDPNPVAYLWEELNDGSCQPGSGGFTPTLAVGRAVSPDEFDRLWDYVASYDYRCYSLRGAQCTTFVLGALERIGMHLDATLHVAIRERQLLRGKSIRFWTDPAYRTLDVPVPQVLEQRLREAVDRGDFLDVTTWYPDLPPTPSAGAP